MTTDPHPPRDTPEWVRGHLRGASDGQAYRIRTLAHDLGWSSRDLWQATGGKPVASRADANRLIHRMGIALSDCLRAEGERLRRDRRHRALNATEQANLEYPPYAAEVRQREWLMTSDDPRAREWRAKRRREANESRRENAGQRAQEKSELAEAAEKHLGIDATGKRVIEGSARRVAKPSPALAMIAALSPESGVSLGDALDDRGHDAPRTEPVTEADHERRRAERKIVDQRVRRRLRELGTPTDGDDRPVDRHGEPWPDDDGPTEAQHDHETGDAP